MSALAHTFEAAGLATVGIASVRTMAELSRPPRMLYAQFPFGRPLGVPSDPEFQISVIDAALRLLERTDVPVLEDYPIVLDDEPDSPLACALPLMEDTSLHPAVTEVLGLRAAFERNRAKTGRTMVTRVGGPDRVRELVEAFVRLVEGSAPDECGIPMELLGPAALDVRAYFEEAAMGLVDHVPAARQTESWFYRTTATGALLKQARDALSDASVPRDLWFRLVPVGQAD